MLEETSTKKLAQTAIEWLDYGIGLLQEHPLVYGHGKNNAKDEAASLIAYALEITPQDSEASLHRPLKTSQQNKLAHVFDLRIRQRLPTPYITHEAYFAGFSFYVDKRVIIPRSPMAEIIEAQFQPYLNSPENLALLDVCCGSGCLGIASWLHCDFIDQVYLSDISEDALEVAIINAKKYHLNNTIHVLQGDLFSPLYPLQVENKESQALLFDIILCNPPYVDSVAMNHLPAEYRHEPSLALDGRKNAHSIQQDGLEIVDQIISECGQFLHPEGWLFLEVGASKDHFLKKYAHLYPIEVELSCEAQGMYVIPASVLKSSYDKKQPATTGRQE